MEYLCYIPPITSSVSVNFQSDPTSAAMLADPFDEIVVEYPQIVNGDPNAVRLTSQTLALLTNHQVWISVKSLWPELATLDPTSAYNQVLVDIFAELQAFWSMIPQRMQRMVKGFCFNHADYYRMFGSYDNQQTSAATFRNLDRYYVNSLIQYAHINFNRPAMIITNKPSDIVGNIYRFGDTTPTFPGAGKWPSLLGQDSFFNDWLIARDMFYTPAVDTSTMDKPFTPGATSNFQFQDGTLGSWWRFFESLPVLQKWQSDNLSVGVIQHLDFSSETTDFSLSPNLTDQQQSFLAGMNSFLSLTPLQLSGVLPIPATGEGIYIPNFLSVSAQTSNITNNSQSNNGQPVSFPPPSTMPRFFSVNSCIYADYMSSGVPIRIVTDAIFSFFNVLQAASATTPLLQSPAPPLNLAG
jgi:hypothetical protein